MNGQRKGPGRPRGKVGPIAGSWNDFLVQLEVGERSYIETTVESWSDDMSIINTPRARRPEILNGREFTAKLFTAVPSRPLGGIRYLICIERIQ